jgi:hypothetical protein
LRRCDGEFTATDPRFGDAELPGEPSGPAHIGGAAFEAEQRHRDRPALTGLPEQLGRRDNGAREEDLGELAGSVRRHHRPNFQPGRRHRHHQHRELLVGSAVRFGAQ